MINLKKMKKQKKIERIISEGCEVLQSEGTGGLVFIKTHDIGEGLIDLGRTAVLNVSEAKKLARFILKYVK